MAKPKVFITRALPQAALDLIAGEADMEVWPEEAPPDPDALREKGRGVAGVLTNIMDRVDRDFFQSCSALKVVSQMAVGVDNIDLAEATRRGIPVGHTPGVLSKATADLTFALLMSVARRVTESSAWVRAGNWKLAFHPLYWLGSEVNEATIGIIGMGQIGMEVAKRARGFDMEVIYCSRSRNPEAEQLYGMTFVEMPELLGRSDYVTLHLPLTTETFDFIGEQELKLMKAGAILVNAARGPIVDTAALYRALKEGHIAGAALDVTEPEPIASDNPLLALDNVVITPHIGSSAFRSRTAMAVLAARNLLAGVKGEPLEKCANPEVNPANLKP